MSRPQPAAPGGLSHHKIAIPRQEKREKTPRKPSIVKQNRVSRACLSCRARKIRCNGSQPTCQNCAENSTNCVYASSRKDRLKTATEHNEEMMDFLRSIRPSVSDAEKTRIDEMLSGVSEDVADAASTFRKAHSSEVPKVDEVEGEATISAEVGSNEDLDMNNEDILRSEQSRATGFMGKNSEIQWLRQIDHETNAPQRGGLVDKPYGPPGDSFESSKQRAEALKERQSQDQVPSLQTSNFSFYLDDESVDMDFAVNPYELPPLETADRLIRCYMDTVQPTFPILAKKPFLNQFYHYYAALARGAPYKLPQKWQVMLNLVFGIGAVYSHLVEPEWQADERDHFLYHARAWELNIKDPWWFSHPDLPQTQIAGLLAIYYLAIGHTNRLVTPQDLGNEIPEIGAPIHSIQENLTDRSASAWVLIGMGVRFGFGLGLHIRNEDHTATAVKKELLSRIWWGLYTLERLLSVMTGRPSVGIESYCSVALPLPLPCDEIEEARIKALFGDGPRLAHTEDLIMTNPTNTPSGTPDTQKKRRDPPNAGSYLKCTIRLGHIHQKILTQLYSPSIIKESWKDVQDTILKINGELEVWAASIPSGLNFSSNNKEKGVAYEQNILLLHYRSTIILINRPCLCRLDRRIPNQTQSSSDFNRRMALSCVNSAKDITASLPDDMNSERTRIYEIFPWWAAVHYIMQSLTILMLETSYHAGVASEQEDTVNSMKKLVRWLRVLRENNGMARRAYRIVLDLLKKMVAHTHVDISDLLDEEEMAKSATSTYRASLLSGLHTQPFFTEEHFENYSFENAYADYPAASGYQTNLFFTEFDQHNPFPFFGNTVMGNTQDSYGASGQPGGDTNIASGPRYQW